jgi:hypothetical protein
MRSDSHWLGRCHGFTAVARDGEVGEIIALVFPPDRREPDFIVVRAGRRTRERRPLVTTALVSDIDPRRRLVFLDVTMDDVMALPEELPVLGGGAGESPE